MSDALIGRIDRELASSTVVRSGMSAYAKILSDYEKALKLDKAAADRQLERSVVDLAARLHRQSSGPVTELLTFSDGANDCLFDATNDRTVLMYGLSKTTPANSRDTPYHQGYPRAGDGYDKGHALSHAQGGTDGGPNYFKQKREINQRRSAAGNLWRDIETYLAANAGVFAFVRLIYTPGETGEMPFEVEYGILNGQSQFRVVVFPNR
jgi:hypothetical protein